MEKEISPEMKSLISGVLAKREMLARKSKMQDLNIKEKMGIGRNGNPAVYRMLIQQSPEEIQQEDEFVRNMLYPSKDKETLQMKSDKRYQEELQKILRKRSQRT